MIRIFRVNVFQIRRNLYVVTSYCANAVEVLGWVTKSRGLRYAFLRALRPFVRRCSLRGLPGYNTGDDVCNARINYFSSPFFSPLLLLLQNLTGLEQFFRFSLSPVIESIRYRGYDSSRIHFFTTSSENRALIFSTRLLTEFLPK